MVTPASVLSTVTVPISSKRNFVGKNEHLLLEILRNDLLSIWPFLKVILFVSKDRFNVVPTVLTLIQTKVKHYPHSNFSNRSENCQKSYLDWFTSQATATDCCFQCRPRSPGDLFAKKCINRRFIRLFVGVNCVRELRGHARGLEVIKVLLLKLSIKMQHRERYLFLSIRSAITFHNSNCWIERHAMVSAEVLQYPIRNSSARFSGHTFLLSCKFITARMLISPQILGWKAQHHYLLIYIVFPSASTLQGFQSRCPCWCC